jgi:hypothetical protein
MIGTLSPETDKEGVGKISKGSFRERVGKVKSFTELRLNCATLLPVKFT